MIITKQRSAEDVIATLGVADKIFLIGCGECSTTCKTGGEDELRRFGDILAKAGKAVTGYCIPSAPCIAAKVKLELAKNRKLIEASDAIIIFACGLGIQSVRENLRLDKPIHVACDTVFMGEVCADGSFAERCSACGECILETTGLICPVTRCPKSLLDGPCGGQSKGKCEVDKTRDCVWILIYNELKRQGRLDLMRKRAQPKDHSKSSRPRAIILPR